MKIYKVGGCVRDTLLGLTPKDIDYVVVGATEQEMFDLGFSRVGADFPVFLHPQTHDEYALARTERKVAAGYNGFEVSASPEVTLEQDLARRDLTINAMAQDAETGEIIDPYGGKRDLEDRLLRHVSDAFAEDPVRVLRTARFAARYGYTVAHSTLKLMGDVALELDHVPQERIWAEFEKGLAENNPVKMFEVLHECGALGVNALAMYRGVDRDCMKQVVESTPMHARFTMCASAFKKTDYERCRIPTEYARISMAFHDVVEDLCYYRFRTAIERVELLDRLRAFSTPVVIEGILDTWKLLQGKGFAPSELIDLIRKDLALAKVVDAEAIAKSCTNGAEIKHKIKSARAAELHYQV